MTPTARKNLAVAVLVLTPIAVCTQYLFSQSLHDGVGGRPTPESFVILPCLVWGAVCFVLLGFLYLSLSKGWKRIGYFTLLLTLCSVGLYIAMDELMGWANAI
ncbi:MAG: hypothetical protein KDA31_02995 [Phycisphaerales bacterium]|nr:hypothetical protein [Phycisphaerales bacterium]MCB9836537.1 hypothetical protein [Phycisphaera sp.]